MHPLLSLLDRLHHRLGRRLLIHRRGLGALLAAAAVWAALQAMSPAERETVPVWTAAADLPAGSTLERDDLHRAAYPADGVPAGAVHSADEVVGRTVLAPVPAGLPITGAQLLGPGTLEGYPGRSALGVRIDPGTAALLRPGDRIALVAGDPQGGTPAERVTGDALVVTVPSGSTDAGAMAGSGRLVVLAVRDAEVTAVSTAAASRLLTVVWTR